MKTNEFDLEIIESGIFVTCYGDDGGELIPVDVAGGDLALTASEEDLLAVAGATSFLPRVQLFGSSSDAVKEGKIGVAHWGIVRGKDQLEDLGKEFNCLVISGRVKALDLSGEKIVTSYDRNTDTFKDIQTRSDVADSKCMFGPEFLIYLPASKEYATVFLSSKTARGEARSLHARLRKAATFKSKLIEGKRFKWHGPVFTPCSAVFEVPAIDEIKTQSEKFLNPADDSPELATGATGTEGGADAGRAR